jgi:hypothetical protein
MSCPAPFLIAMRAWGATPIKLRRHAATAAAACRGCTSGPSSSLPPPAIRAPGWPQERKGERITRIVARHATAEKEWQASMSKRVSRRPPLASPTAACGGYGLLWGPAAWAGSSEAWDRSSTRTMIHATPWTSTPLATILESIMSQPTMSQSTMSQTTLLSPNTDSGVGSQCSTVPATPAASPALIMPPPQRPTDPGAAQGQRGAAGSAPGPPGAAAGGHSGGHRGGRGGHPPGRAGAGDRQLPARCTPRHGTPAPARCTPQHGTPAPARCTPQHGTPAPARCTPQHGTPAPARCTPQHGTPELVRAPLQTLVHAGAGGSACTAEPGPGGAAGSSPAAA